MDEDQFHQQADMFERLVSGTTRMQAMIDWLLEFARLNTRGQAFFPVELEQVALGVLEDLEIPKERAGPSTTSRRF